MTDRTLGSLPSPLALVANAGTIAARECLDSVVLTVDKLGGPQNALTKSELFSIRVYVEAFAKRIAALIATDELSPSRDFPIESDSTMTGYIVAEQPGHKITVCIMHSSEAHSLPAHNHGTWTIISGIFGSEISQQFRVRPNQKPIREKAVTIKPGVCIVLEQDTYHSVGSVSRHGALVAHVYGQNVTTVTDRKQLDLESGETRPLQPPITGLKKYVPVNARINFKDLPTECGKHNFVGEEQGKKARAHFKLEGLEKEQTPVIVIEIPDDVYRITGSFFRGLFSASLDRMGSRSAFFAQYQIVASLEILSQIEEELQWYYQEKSAGGEAA